MSYVVQHHAAAADPFLKGTSAAQLVMMMPLTHGRMFPWRSGGAALLRRGLYPVPAPWTFCGLAGPNATQISQFESFTHQADQAYEYVCVTLLGNGMVSVRSPIVRMDFDAVGDLISPGLPTAPRHVTTEPIALGKLRVSWVYDPNGQAGWPADFQVFEGPDAASVDYNTPLVDSITGLDHVPFDARPVAPRRSYSFTTQAFAEASDHVFVVRARNASALAEKNTRATPVRKARAAVPVGAVKPVRAIVASRSRRRI